MGKCLSMSATKCNRWCVDIYNLICIYLLKLYMNLCVFCNYINLFYIVYMCDYLYYLYVYMVYNTYI